MVTHFAFLRACEDVIKRKWAFKDPGTVDWRNAASPCARESKKLV